jgi:hypothetical protein
MASIFPGLRTAEAAEALSRYLDEAGIERTEDRLSALHRHYAVTWLDMLKKAGVTGFDIFDIQDGRDRLLAQMRAILEPQP